MKSTMKIMIAAVALAVVSGIASAQPMNADIPFAFRFAGHVYPAGTYTLTTQASGPLVRLYNYDTRTNVIALSQSMSYPNGEKNSNPVLTVTCGSSRCELTRIWLGGEAPALNLHRARLGRDEVATIRLIPLSRSNGE